MSNATTSKRATIACPVCDALNGVDLERLVDGPRCGECGRPLQLDRPQPISAEALDRIVAETDVPVVIDFYADWCGPCRLMAPILDALALERAGEVLVGKLDTDRYPAVTMRFGVRGIPTLIVFSGGREVARQVGAMSRSALDALLGSSS